MLELILPGYEPFDQETQTFGKVVKPTKIKLEHSLIAISKWEQIWHKPLLKLMDEGTLTDEEFFDYMYCMIVGSFDKVEFFKRLDDHLLKKVTDYINDPATASRVFTIGDDDKGKPETLTSELIYAYLAIARIPFDPCEKWNIKRVFMLIELYTIKTNPPKKMSNEEIRRWQKKENERRKKALKTRG